MAGQHTSGFRGWLRAVPQASTYLGLALIAGTWLAVWNFAEADRVHAVRNAEQTTATLATAYEGYMVRAFKEVDKTLLILRGAHDAAPTTFDLPTFTRSAYFVSDVTLQISLIGRDGFLKSTNLGPQATPVDLSDREHFRIQRDSRSDDLFISKPVLGRASGKWSIQLTRKLESPDRGFDGVLVASIDPAYLAQFFDSMEASLGQGGSITLVGSDGIVRTRGSKALSESIGKPLAGSTLLAQILDKPEAVMQGADPEDQKPSVIAYRKVAGFPLHVIVAQPMDDVLAGATQRRVALIGIALSVTLVVVAVMAAGLLQRLRLTAALDALRQSESEASARSDELQVALGNISQGIMMIDASRTVAVINRRAIELLGLPDRFLTDRPTFDEVLQFQWETGEFGPQGTHVAPDVLRYIKAGGTGTEVTVYERRRPNGIVLEIRSLPLPGGGIVRTFSDITERTQTAAVLAEARDRAESASRARTAFLAMMSHEIRTPLNGVIGMAGLLADTTLDAEQRRYTSTLRDSAEHLLQIIDDVLDFSKLEADRGTFEEVAFDVERTLGSMLGIVAPRAREKGLFLGAFVDPATPDLVVGDAGALRQVLLNLVGNGVKFTPEGSVVVEVSVAKPVEPEDDRVVLQFDVRDTGIGIDPAGMSSLFQEFSQLDGSISRRFGGTGLGLAISKHLVERLGGTISVESMPGEGTTFTFTMPFGRAEGATRGRTVLPLAGETWLVVASAAEARAFHLRQLDAYGAGADSVAEVAAAERWLGSNDRCRGVILDESCGPLEVDRLARFVRGHPTMAASVLILVMPLGSPGHPAESAALFDGLITAPVLPHAILDIATGARATERPALPVPAAEGVGPAAPSAVASGQAAHRPRVLLAEDNRTNRLVLRALLDRLGYETVAVEDGRAAVDEVQRQDFALVVMDIMMPELDGFGAARAIRALAGPAAAVPMIALSAHAGDSDMETARDAGMDELATKPVTRERLQEVIASAMAQRGRAAASTSAPATAPLPQLLDRSAWDAIRAELDPSIVDVILGAFVEDTQERLDRLDRMDESELTPARVSQEAHPLKSAAATFGFARLSQLAAQLDKGAAAMSALELRAGVNRLRPTFEASREALHEVQSSTPEDDHRESLVA